MEAGLGGASSEPLSSPAAPESGETAPNLGPYELVERLGEGGMGIVYRARQEGPLKREVAVKILRPGIDSREVLARFDIERQALAVMDHRNVAKVHDAGNTEDGRPYFVMELIRGLPITEYCDRNRLGIRERLLLFLEVCDGVHHAHQKGIIHRDIKPSNVPVADDEGRGVPKVIDFGVAKATQGRLTERTLATEAGQILGTPEYMSPEQIDPGAADIDTRADVYSLGVLLYELLAGAQPFDRESLREASYAELQRVIREKTPPTPSARLTALEEGSAEGGEQRGSESATLAREVRGDLDWITMKALEKDRERRYSSVAELAADLRRYFDNEPVSAGPPSAAYRVEKFVRRHRVGVGVGMLALVFLVVLGISNTIQARRVAKERDRANTEARSAEEVARFLVDLFQAPDPMQPVLPGTRPATVRDFLDVGVAKIDTELRSQPAVRLRLMVAIGSTYAGLTHFPEARDLLQRTLDEAREELGERHPITLEAMVQLARPLARLQRYQESLELAQGAVEAYEVTVGERHLQTVRAKLRLADVLYFQAQDRVLEASEVNQAAIEVLREVLGPEDPETLAAVRSLARDWIALGRREEAEELLQQVLATHLRRFGENHLETARTLQRLAQLRRAETRFDEEERLRLRVFEIYREVLGEGHIETLRAKRASATVPFRGQPARTVRMLEETLEGVRAIFGPVHWEVLDIQRRLAGYYSDVGRYEESEALARKTAVDTERVLGPDHPLTLDAGGQVGNLLMEWGRYEEAEPYHLRGVEGHRRRDPDSFATASAYGFAAINYLNMGRYLEAEEFMREGLRIWELREDDYAVSMAAKHLLVIAWLATGEPNEAMKIWTEFGLALADQRPAVFLHPAAAEALEVIGDLLEEQERLDEARRLWAAAAQLRSEL